MTDPLGPTPGQFNEANAAHAAGYGALVILLIDKGVITKQEYDRAYLQAQREVDQEFARKRDAADAETTAKLKRLYPGPLGEAIAKLFRDEKETP